VLTDISAIQKSIRYKPTRMA